MMDRRLDNLERVFQRPKEPVGPPWDPTRLTVDERVELDELNVRC